MKIPRALLTAISFAGRAAGLAFVEAFVADAKASGLVAQSIARSGLRGVTVTP